MLFINLYKYLAAAVIAFLFHFHDHFLYHLNLANPFSGNVLTHFLSVHGWACTEMFFILSGLLFVHAYHHRIAENQLSFGKFMNNRFDRVMPMVILTSVCAYALEWIYFLLGIKSWSGSIDPLALLWNVTIGSAAVFHTHSYLNEPVWYIGVLLLCYCIGFMLIKAKRGKDMPLIFLLPVIAGVFIFHLNNEYPLLNVRTARGLIGFFLGCLLEEVFCRFTSLSVKQKRKLAAFCIAVLCIGLFSLAANYLVNPFLISNMYVFYDIFIFTPIIILSGLCGPLNRLCSHKLFRSIGKISNGIYLWDFVIYAGIYLVLRVFPGSMALAENSILIIWLFSTVLHHLMAWLSGRFLDRFC